MCKSILYIALPIAHDAQKGHFAPKNLGQQKRLRWRQKFFRHCLGTLFLVPGEARIEFDNLSLRASVLVCFNTSARALTRVQASAEPSRRRFVKKVDLRGSSVSDLARGLIGSHD